MTNYFLRYKKNIVFPVVFLSYNRQRYAFVQTQPDGYCSSADVKAAIYYTSQWALGFYGTYEKCFISIHITRISLTDIPFKKLSRFFDRIWNMWLTFHGFKPISRKFRGLFWDAVLLKDHSTFKLNRLKKFEPLFTESSLLIFPFTYALFFLV